MRRTTRARTMLGVLLAAVVGGAVIGLGPETGFAPAVGSRLDAQVADDRAAERREMVMSQIESRGVTNPRVLDAMRSVPRHRFVPPAQQAFAYADRPLPIGHQQTISQPYIVALMSALANVGPGDRVLEVGTGSGYQAAVLAQMGADVFSIEIVAALGARAKATLRALGYGGRIRLRIGDGYAGWPDKAPFAAIVVTAAPPSIPEPLKAQLAIGGRLVIPVGDRRQRLLVVTRTPTGFEERTVIPVRFVPMTGKAQDL
ncbi:MAG: protein-L-isoaspartate(D-aspartate) O-methyltransferase [Myxococcota bacterium]